MRAYITTIALFCLSTLTGVSHQASAAAPSAAASELQWQSPALRASIAAAYAFLSAQMDKCHERLVVSGDPACNTYYPSGFMGDRQAVRIREEVQDSPAPGHSILRIDYTPRKSEVGWAGVQLQYPDANWGQYKGRDLRGATELSATVTSPRPMLLRLTSAGIISPEQGWQINYDIQLAAGTTTLPLDLSQQDLSQVIAPLALVLTQPGTLYLGDVTMNLSRLGEPRFIQSFVPTAQQERLAAERKQPLARNTAHLYDEAVVLLAFLAQPDDADHRRRASLIAQAMLSAQAHDRHFKDGRLRNAYASGDILDPCTQTSRLPGRFNPYDPPRDIVLPPSDAPCPKRLQQTQYEEDEYAAGSDTGNLAWAALALVQSYFILKDDLHRGEYLAAARRLADWIVAHHRWPADEGNRGGFSGGYACQESDALGRPVAQAKRKWRSTEHNIDAFALFSLLANAAAPESRERGQWQAQADYARGFVASMREADHHLWTGTLVDPPEEPRKTTIPLDVQAWSVLGIGSREYASALTWALEHCRGTGAALGFHFQCTADIGSKPPAGVWWEGTAQVATALSASGRSVEALPIVLAIERAQAGPASGAPGSIPAASIPELDTGFADTSCNGKQFERTYPNEPHIAATAWYVLAALQKNPYNLMARADGD